jgi:trans-aconitate methyltransferase
VGITKEKEFHCFAALSDEDRRSKKEALSRFLPYFKNCKAIADIGSGDGVFLELLNERYPQKNIVGIEPNDELIELSKSKGQALRIVKDDAVSFMLKEGPQHDGYILSDLIEHLDFESGLKIMELVPDGGVLFIKTPNTDSLLGHQYYLQMPSHKTPYSPFVLKNMLERTGFNIIAEGECDGVFSPRSLAGKIRRKILHLLFIDEYPRLFGGGNYYVVAKKC